MIFDLDATALVVWGFVAHLVADWLFQNEWMSLNKTKRASEWVAPDSIGEQVAIDETPFYVGWFFRHPAAYVHAGIHGLVQLLVFPWPAAALIAVTHLVIDTRTPVVWWSKLIRQTQPLSKPYIAERKRGDEVLETALIVDIGTEVRIWVDQVMHIAVIAAMALLVSP